MGKKGAPKGHKDRRTESSSRAPLFEEETNILSLSLSPPPPSAQPRLLQHRFQHRLRRVRVAVAAPRQAGLLSRREGRRGLGDALGEALVADGLFEKFFLE